MAFHTHGLTRGLTRAFVGFGQGRQEAEERQREREREAVLRELEQFNLEAGRQREAREQVRFRGEQETEAREAFERSRKERQQEEARERRIKIGQAIREGKLDEAFALMAEGGEPPGPLVSALRARMRPTPGVTPTSLFGARERALRDLARQADEGARQEWRLLAGSMTARTTGTVFDPTTGKPITFAEVRERARQRLEQEQGLEAGTLTRAVAGLAVRGELEFEPGEEPEPEPEPEPGAADELAEARAMVRGVPTNVARAKLKGAGFSDEEIAQILGQ